MAKHALYSLSLSFLRKQESIQSMKNYYIYMLASSPSGTLYIGMTNDLVRRVYEHKNNLVKGFTNKYKTHHLVYFEYTSDVESAISREKQMKKWKRKWKNRLKIKRWFQRKLWAG